MTPRLKTLRAALATVVVLVLTLVAVAATTITGLAVGSHAELGAILTDGDGNSLYLFSNDSQGESKCYETCADNWPPVTAEGDVTAGEGVDAALIGSVARTDGMEQVTYGGWPLYRFVGDTEAGMTAGQGLNEVWYLVTPAGTAVGADADPATETETEAETSAAGGEDELFATYMEEGARVFSRICAACHGANGNEALASHVAILEENSRLENERRVLTRIIHGGGYMPGFGNALSDHEVAAVATFVRNSFGNEFGFVGEEAAAAIR